MSSLTVQLFAWKCLFSLLPLIENDVLCYSVPSLKMILFKYNCTCRLDFLSSDMFKSIIVFVFFRQTSKLLSFKIYLRFVNALFSSCIVSTSPAVKATQGSQVRQIWRILRKNCSDDSTEVMEGVTSTPEIFGNKQGATSTPEIFGNKHSFVLTFFTTNAIYVIVNIVNLN